MKYAPRTLTILWAALAAPALGAQSPEALDSAFHVLNRLAYGPRPGEVQAVAHLGVMNWIEQQLEPTAIPNPRLDELMPRFTYLSYSRQQLGEMYFQRILDVQELQRQGMERPEIQERMRQRTDRERVGPQPQQLALTRAIVSERQLQEVLTDFWFNHFNVFAAKSFNRFLTPIYIEETIRPNVLGRFEDLLIATAQSPAMMVYLDNAQSVTPGSMPPQLERAMRRPGRRGGMSQERMEQIMARMPKGINENYARELMELHTLGVDGGYSQQDVEEVARILTGWSTARPRQGAGFEYHDWAHDDGEKTVLGRTYSNDGEDEGLALLRDLARHPSTQYHVSRKLCERFVADEAPDSCIDVAVRTWQRTDGDIRSIVHAIVTSPDFWSPAVRRAKTKTPLEFVVSAVRAVDGEPDSTPRLVRTLQGLGQPLFLSQPPTGYPETQEHWVNSGALLNRMKIALGIVSPRTPGVEIDLNRHFDLTDDREQLMDEVNRLLFGGQMSARTMQVIREQTADITDPQQLRAYTVALAIGGPDFQRQ